ncbi:DUF6702 family protein [Maricaulis sp.]|uniref:DUF6702 family protein n=1 Tax=Maricaulis sp. TaxID=1486257 RepID=UPI00261CB0C9|nr:DUF6702 family protein [Maricaulis sp.]
MKSLKASIMGALIAGVVVMTAPAFAHKVHAGATEVSLNPRTGEMEVVHRIFADDLMVAIGRDDGDAEDVLAEAAGLEAVRDYTLANFRLGDPTGLLYELNYVGAEIDGEFAWIYFITEAPQDESGFTVDNDLLADVLDDQVMMTNFRFNSLVRTAMQGEGRREPVRVSFAD